MIPRKYQAILFISVLAGALIFFQEKLWIAPLAGLYLAALYLYRDRFIIIFGIISFLTLTSTIDPQLRFIVLVLNVLSLLYLFLREQDLRNIQFSPLPKELIMFFAGTVLWMIISSLFSSYTAAGLEQVIRTVVFLPIMYLFYAYIKSLREVRIVIFSLIAVAVFYSLFLFYELYNNNFVLISVEEQLSYVFGMRYLDKNFLGGFISMAILLIAAYMFYSQRYRKVLSAALVLCITGVLLSNSRAAIMSLSVAGFVLLWIFNRKVFYRAAVVFVIVIVIFFLSPLSEYVMVYARFESISSGRDYLLTAAENVISNHFFLGAGPSATRFEMYNHLPFMLGSPEELFIRKNFYQSELGQAHSFYLFYFTDLGIIGFIISLVFPVIYFKYSLALLKFYKDKGLEEYYITRALFTAGILMFVRGLLEWGGIFTFGNINQDLPFWLVLSILTFYYTRVQSNARVHYIPGEKN